MIALVAFVQFVVLSAGKLGEQWDSTELDVEVKKALDLFQTADISDRISRYSKLRDRGLLRMPYSESVGYRLMINGNPVDQSIPPDGVEVATSDARIYHLSRDSPRLVRSFRERLLRSIYVEEAGHTMDYDGVDELADLIMGLMWDPESQDIVSERVSTLIDNRNDDGGWGFISGEESDTLCTAMSVRALSKWLTTNGEDTMGNSTVVDGIRWLRDRVHADGGYGSRERIESSVEMTAHAVLAYDAAGLGAGDTWVSDALDFMTRLQRPDGGFPYNRRGDSDVSSTAMAVQALMAADGSQFMVESACDYLAAEMISDGNFTFTFDPVGGTGTYDVTIETGYVVDCSPRGYEFWGDHLDDSIIGIVDVYGDKDSMTVTLRIERPRLVPPDNKQKIALAFSHNMTPDDTDWWILNAGNPHTAGQGDKIDDPKFDQYVDGAYTYLTITDLEVPDEYEFFNESEDWLLVMVGDESHPLKDNPGRGYLIGYWNAWMKAFDVSNILAWRAWSPIVNRVCLDVDRDWEFDDRRLQEGDTVEVRDMTWELSIWQNETTVNLTFRNMDFNYTRYYLPLKYDLSSIPESVSGLYHFGVMSKINKPSLYKDFKVVLRDSQEEGVYDEAYIWNVATGAWDMYGPGMVFDDGATEWIIGIEGDFLTLTRNTPTTVSGASGSTTSSLIAEGDFVKVDVDPDGPKEVWLTALHEGFRIDRTMFSDSIDVSFRQMFGSWGKLRESSKVYETLTLAEDWLSDGGAASEAHNVCDLGQQTIKFNKLYNSVIEDKLSVAAWDKSQGGG